jgi:two-component system response regulator RegX3
VSARLLVADDERAILDSVCYTLRREGFEVDEASDGRAALDSARAHSYDLIVLDLMMPGLSGLDVCRALRAESDVPILMLTAKDAELDLVLGLELGADDYVTKPFSMAELVSRIRAILRRRELDRAAAGGTVRTVGGVRIDLARHEVVVDGDERHLTPSEFKVLALLAEQPGRVLSRRQIMEHLWASIYVGDERAADVHVSSLRRKIEREPTEPERLVTVRGVGYKLVAG